MTSAYSVQAPAILSLKAGHDGCIAYLADRRLHFSFEAEKDNGQRYSELTPEVLLKALSSCPKMPDVVALSGWSQGEYPTGEPIWGGYLGLVPSRASTSSLFGREVALFQSSHERSHLMGAYAMSPFPQGQECYALLWEGHIGAFYFIDSKVSIVKLADILVDPGIRYAYPYAIADATFPFPDTPGAISLNHAGKLMAIAAYATGQPLNHAGMEILESLLNPELCARDFVKRNFAGNYFYDQGVSDPQFAELAKALSDRLFELFLSRVQSHVTKRAPLLISGGCGLNCEWNTRWKETGLFDDVFIPPCANDSGSAIGTAVDAMHYFSGEAKIVWSAYLGESPVDDGHDCQGFTEQPFDLMHIARFLAADHVIGWVQGRSEIGPRALGARSILASPKNPQMLQRLNSIKLREGFRPVAPVCLQEDMSLYFQPAGVSPYMLEFRRVVSDAIPAVTHVDGSARPQSVNADQNATLYSLLTVFREVSGVGVLCNTSLNFNGRGFLNRLSHLHTFAVQHGLDGFVFERRFFVRRQDAHG
jgi:hydroxymethyl cephem carbamoyltransferase